MPNADSTFQIGKDHIVCEDYALAGIKDDLAYAIVCDGCSASADVELGARMLALAAREELMEFTKVSSILTKDFDLNTIRLAKEVISNFSLVNEFALDATLALAFVKNNTLFAQIYGDGVLIHRRASELVKVHIHLTSGAPDYLSYLLDANRQKAYDKIADNTKEIDMWDGESQGHRTYKPFEPFIYTCPVSEGDTISVISDGINSFRKSDNTAIDWKELVDEFTGFKNFEGQFVLRRIAAFKRKCLKETWHHHDDISIATIVV